MSQQPSNQRAQNSNQINNLTPEMQKQLEQLKDIQMPEPISWFPFAMGWWVVIFLVILVIVFACYRFIKKRQILKKNTLAELHALSEVDNVKFVSDLSALLRRVAIHSQLELAVDNKEQSIQKLSGQAWADFLSTSFMTGRHDKNKQGMPKELAEMIAYIPYNDKLADDIDIVALKKASEQWIIQALKGRKR